MLITLMWSNKAYCQGGLGMIEPIGLIFSLLLLGGASLLVKKLAKNSGKISRLIVYMIALVYILWISMAILFTLFSVLEGENVDLEEGGFFVVLALVTGIYIIGTAIKLLIKR